MKRLAPILALVVLGVLVVLWRGPWSTDPERGLDGAGPSDAERSTPEDVRGGPTPDGDAGDPQDGDAMRAAAAPGESDPEPAATPDGARLLVRVVDPEGRPLPEERVLLVVARDGTNGRHDGWRFSDADGLVRVEGLPAGKAIVKTPTGGRAEGALVVGEELELELVREPGVAVVGRVRDADGRPVADARIWQTTGRVGWLGGFEVARSGADGSFALEHAPRERALGAYAPGYGPSELVDLKALDLDEPPISVTLELTRPGGEVRGVVRAPDGTPVTDARVAAGEGPRYFDFSPAGMKEMWTARTARSDAEGRFHLMSLAPGTHALHASADGHPPYVGEVTVVDGGTVSHDVWFVEGASVSGRILRADGTPAEGAQVLVLPEPFVDSFPGQGPTDEGRPFRVPAARADADGRFVLTDLAPGTTHLHASLGTRMWTPWNGSTPEFEGSTQETLELVPGVETTWLARLTLGLSIRGRVTYLDGVPMKDVFLSATDSDGLSRAVTTDEEGHFAAHQLEDRPYDLRVQLWDPPAGSPALTLEGVRPSENEVSLVASYPAPTEQEKATVRLRVTDPTDRLPGPAEIMLYTDKGSGWFVEREGDRYHARIDPGRCRVVMSYQEALIWAGEWFDVVPGEERDLGTLEVPATSTLVLRVERPEGVEVPVRVTLPDAPYHAPMAEVPADRDELRIDDFPPGTQRVELRAQGLGTVCREVELVSGAERELTVRLHPGTPVHFRLDLDPREGYGQFDFELRAASGVLQSRSRLREIWDPDLPAERRVDLPPGEYTYTLFTTSGRSASGALTLTGEAELEPIEVVAR